MSSTLLSRQDVASWVPEPSRSKSGAGFVARLFTDIYKAMASFVEMLTMTKDEAHHSCRNDFERLLLWGQGLSVVDGDLDDVLIHAQELHDQVLTLLLRLGTAVLQGLSRDPSVLSQVMMEQCDDLRSLLETTEAMLREPESDEPARPYTPAGSDASEYGTTEVAEEITIYTDCLLDLSPALDNPALDINVGGSGEPPGQAKESFTVSSDEALIYCRRIRDRFEPLPKYLVERLAKANVNRATVLRDRRSRSAKPGILVTDDITESLFSSADYRLTDTTKSTAPSSSVFSSIAQPKATAREILGFNDNSSDATFASFSTTASAIGLGRPRVPPLPAMSGDGFDCPICSLHTIGVRNRKDWKKHVFNDLKPYVCLCEWCHAPSELYNHSFEWAVHIQSHQPKTPASMQCPFCTATYEMNIQGYYRHLSAHLREVSLFVLPQPADDHDVIDTDDSDTSLSSQAPVSIPSSAIRPEIAEPPGGTGTEDVLNPASFDLDSVIDRLLEVRGSRPGKQVRLLESEIRELCQKAREIFVAQPVLVELEAPIKVVGDLHGQYYDLLRIFEYGGFPPEANYLFLGNYVNHGKQSIETICLILAFKIKYPENFFPLRGNHDCASMTRKYGFYDECKRRYNLPLWKCFTDTFNCMPVASIIDEKVFCMHGGLSPDLNSFEQIRRILRPTEIPETGLFCDLLWSDPDRDITSWIPNDDRGISFAFGPDVVSHFLEKQDMDLIVRGHEVVENGWEVSDDQKLVTVWGAPDFKGAYNNSAAILDISETLACSFQVLKPLPEHKPKPTQGTPELSSFVKNFRKSASHV